MIVIDCFLLQIYFNFERFITYNSFQVQTCVTVQKAKYVVCSKFLIAFIECSFLLIHIILQSTLDHANERRYNKAFIGLDSCMHLHRAF